MKRVWYIFKEYYLTSLIILFILFSILLFSIDSKDDKVAGYYISILMTLALLFFDTIDFLRHEYYRPRKINRLLKHNPFLDFEKKGFKKNRNQLIGQISGYCVCVGIEWEAYQKKPNYYFKVLYNPFSLDRYITFNEFIKFNDLIDKDGFYINPNSIERSYSKRELSKYHYRDILREIDKMIVFLKLKERYSVSYDEWESSLTKAEEIHDDYLSMI